MVRMKELLSNNFSNWLYAPYGATQKSFLDDLLNLAVLDKNMIELIVGLVPCDQIFHTTFDVAKMIDQFSEKNWGEIKQYYFVFPDLKESLLFKYFTFAVGGYNGRELDLKLSRMTAFFGLDWIHFRDQSCNTLLHHLFSLQPQPYNSYIKPTIVYMIENGFDPGLKNKDGKTVRDIAVENQWHDFINLLQ